MTAPGPRRRELALAGLHLAVLWSLAVAQPLLDVLGDAPEFFVARENTRGDLLLLAFGLTLLPPVLLTAAEALVGRAVPAAWRPLHLVLVAVLAGAFFLQLLDDLTGGGRSAVLLPLAALLGAAAAAAYARTRHAPALLTALSPAPLVFIAVFLTVSPVSELVLPHDDVAVTPAAIRGETPVVMIVFDELPGLSLLGPDRRIDAARLPGFARLARDATWYRNATTVADFTERAVPGLLTGEVPERGSLPIAADHPQSLFTLLGDAYARDVTEPVTDICPRRLCPETSRPSTQRRLRDLVSDLSVVSGHLLLPHDLDERLPPVDRSFGGFGRGQDAGRDQPWVVPAGATEERVRQFDGFVERLARGPARRLSFLHVELPHTPFEFLPSGQRYPAPAQPAGLGAAGVWTSDGGLVRQAHRRHLLQVGYADRLLGRALTSLRRAGIYDRALIVVAADHGIAFRPGAAYRAVSAATLPQIASVPLLVKAPGQRHGRTDDANVRTIDVLPAVASALGTRLPWEVQGRVPGRGRTPARVSVQAFYGRREVSIGFAEFVRRRDALNRRQAVDFATGTAGGLFRAGPDADLVGRPLAGVRTTAVPDTRFELDDAAWVGGTDPRAPVVPSLLSGRVLGRLAVDRLAIALNGRIAAVAHAAQDGGGRRFQAMVPPRAFSRSANRVAVLAISGAGARRRLIRLGGETLGGYRLVDRGDGQAIVGGPGGELRVEEGIEGFVEETTVRDGVARIKGWAADTRARRPAELALAFAGGRLVAAGRPSLLRADLHRRFGASLAGAGFSVTGSVPPGAGGLERLQVFGVVGKQASPLPRAGG